jgi:hypothetical protein
MGGYTVSATRIIENNQTNTALPNATATGTRFKTTKKASALRRWNGQSTITRRYLVMPAAAMFYDI